MEIRLARKNLQVNFSNLNNADYTNASIAINDFLDFLNENEQVSKVVRKLPTNAIDIDEWVKNFYNNQDLTLPRNKSERIAFLLKVLEKYKDDILPIIHIFRVNSAKINDHLRKYVDDMVRPIYQYIDAELHEEELQREPISNTSITANNVVMINGDNYGSISQANNDAIRLLNELSQELQKSDKLSTDQKLEAIVNIDTIKAQMAVTHPSLAIIKLAWNLVSATATISGAIDLASKISSLLPHSSP